MNGEGFKDPTADRAIGRVAREEAYERFGVRIGQIVAITERNDGGKIEGLKEAKVVQFHPDLRRVRVKYLKSGQSECFTPLDFRRVRGGYRE